MNSKWVKKLVAFLVLSVAGVAVYAVTTPNTFVAGQPAVASQVNANFSALVTAINNIEARLDALEGTLTEALIPGIYQFKGVELLFHKPAGATFVEFEHGVQDFIVTLNSDKTLTVTGGSEKGSLFNFDYATGGASSLQVFNNPATNPPLTGTWSLSGRTLTFVVPGGTPGGAKFTAVSRNLFVGVEQPEATATDTNEDLNLLIRTGNLP